MTKYETISFLKAYLDGDTNVGNVISPRSVLEAAIEYLEPSLPSNLDEAADRMASDIAPDYPDISWDTCFEKIKAGIKTGAVWMAGQGVKASASVGYYNQCGLSILTEPSIKKLGFKEGDELEITLRKK